MEKLEVSAPLRDRRDDPFCCCCCLLFFSLSFPFTHTYVYVSRSTSIDISIPIYAPPFATHSSPPPYTLVSSCKHPPTFDLAVFVIETKEARPIAGLLIRSQAIPVFFFLLFPLSQRIRLWRLGFYIEPIRPSYPQLSTVPLL